VYACRGCGHVSPTKWRGPCLHCDGFWAINTRAASASEHPDAQRYEPEEGQLVDLCDVSEDVEEAPRLKIGGKLFKSTNALLGGGIVPGTVTLLSGPPGAGKSTVALQMLQRLAQRYRVLYATGEESIKKVALRAKRLGDFSDKLKAINQTSLVELLEHVDDVRPAVAVIDSVQTLVVDNEITGEPLRIGSPASIETAIREISKHAQESEVAYWIIGHVTRDGEIAGPSSGLMHAVDTILYFGMPNKVRRVLRCDGKNRYGSITETALFDMTAAGLVEANEDEEEETTP
jgi:DNA repair protein RadA/Sms